jgi:hypothetical protein
MKLLTQPKNVLTWLRQLSVLDIAKRRLTSDTPAFVENGGEAQILREKLPTAILLHYDQRRARGKPGLVAVKNGVCGSCHLSLPGGKASEMRRTEGALNQCDHCGSLIFQDAEDLRLQHAVEPTALPDSPRIALEQKKGKTPRERPKSGVPKGAKSE